MVARKTFSFAQIPIYSNERRTQAIDNIVRFINGGFPVLVAVSYMNAEGHSSSVDFKLVVHDPYGQFDLALKSKLFGKRRCDGGASLLGGGEWAPGMGTNCRLTRSTATVQETHISACTIYCRQLGCIWLVRFGRLIPLPSSRKRFDFARDD